jgi:hypothetical protein
MWFDNHIWVCRKQYGYPMVLLNPVLKISIWIHLGVYLCITCFQTTPNHRKMALYPIFNPEKYMVGVMCSKWVS